jgi:hypothetical protein
MGIQVPEERGYENFVAKLIDSEGNVVTAT